VNLFGVMDISASALKAERVRAEVVAANMANAETTQTPDGGPYRRHHVVFEAADSGSFGATLLSAGNPVGGAAGSLGTNLLGSNLFASSLMGSSVAPGGVAVSGVIEDGSAPLSRYDPQHPDANSGGYVAYPDINPLTEMVDLMGATRSYGLNVSAFQAEKSMVSNSLELLK
jgi:flagellar basal-body rod protein FlgC